MPNKQTEYSVQYLENLSADLSVTPPVLRRALLGKKSDGSYNNVIMNADGSFGEVDGAITLSYTDGSLTQVDKAVGSVTYRKTLSYTSGSLTGVTAWTVV